MSVDRLIETINGALQRAGGEAARVWPDMVAAWRFRGVVNVLACALLIAVSAYFARRCLRFSLVKTADDNSNDVEIGGWIGFVLCAVVVVVAFIVLVDNIDSVVYPEPALLTWLLRPVAK